MTRSTMPQTMRSLSLAALAFALTMPAAVHAQESGASSRRGEFRVTGGAFVPAGTQGDYMKNAHYTAVQGAWLVRPAVAITATIGWARSRSLLIADTPKLDVLSADVGLEYRTPVIGAGTVSFSPFVGAGVGARSYDSRARNVSSARELAGYAAVGGELGVGRVGLRLEARGYAAGANALASGATSGRVHDVVMMIGLRFNRHTAGR